MKNNQNPNPPNRSKCIFKEVFSHCHKLSRQVPASSPEVDSLMEEEEIVSAIRSRAMEKLRQKSHFMMDSFSLVFCPTFGDLYILPNGAHKKDNHHEDVDDEEEFLSVRSCFSCRSSAASEEAFLSVKTNLSRCSSLNEVHVQELHKRSILEQLYHCEGWPFGLYRKLILFPPLPKSPSESWSWHKGTKIMKTQYI